ncbi:hypothetical protein Taro_046234 [Colocasia esculenta]|uniref:Secreted protein n=1 Tax=Colocasia esculenta TaxID=4460 RepID=A0A843WT97_COLES|nr:hypothetical protein [Colocasia esculenta]
MVVAFLLPLLSVDICMRAKCRALGGPLTSGVGRRRPPMSRSGSARPGGSCCDVSWRFGVLEVRGACSLRVDIAWSGGNVERSPVFAFFAKVPVPCVGNGLWWYIVYQSILVLTWNCVLWRS